MKKFIILDQSAQHQRKLHSIILNTNSKANIYSPGNIKTFYELLVSDLPDIVYINTDYDLFQGATICKRLKSESKFNHIPVILLTNQQVSIDSANDILNSDADAIFSFPIDELSFQIQLKSLLKLKELHQDLTLKRNNDLKKEVDELRETITTLRNSNELLANNKIKQSEIQPKKQEILHSMENRISETEGKFKSFIQNSTEGIIIIDSHGLIIEMNNCLEEITGFKKENYLGTPIWDFQSQLSLNRDTKRNSNNLLKEFISQILSDHESEAFGKLTEKQIIRKNGQSRYIETNLYPIHSNGNFYVVSIIRDITQRKLFEEAVKNSESKYHGIFHANKDGISISFINPDKSVSNFVEANKAAYEMLGYTQAEFLALKMNDLESNKVEIPFKKRIASILKNKQTNFETSFRHQDGHLITVDVIIVPIRYNHRLAIMNIVRDITERTKIEADLSRSENLYRNLVERLPDGIYKSSHEGKFIEVNPAMVKILGYNSKEELYKIDIKNDLYFEPEDRESVTLQEKYEEMGIFRLRRKDRTEIWVEDHGWYTLDENGEIIFHEGIMRDISERKIAEEALKESEERFKMLFEKAPVGYLALDENGILTDINEAWTEILGYSKEEAIGTGFKEYLTFEYQEFYQNKFPNIKSFIEANTEVEMIRKDGEILIIRIEGRIGHNQSGEFKQTHCVLSDITEKRKAEKAIADDRILLRTVIDNIPDAIYVKDTHGRKLISNKADLEILGLTNENEAFGKTDMELAYPGNSLQTFDDDIYVIQTSQPIINKLEFFTDLNGIERHFLTNKMPLINDSGKIIGLVGVGHEITQQRKSDQKIIQLSKGIEQSPASIMITDIQGNIEYANQKVQEITGYSIEEIKGQNPRIFQSGYTSQQEYSKLWSTIESGNEYRGEIRNRKKNGDLFWESVLVFPIRDEIGKIVHYMAIKEDITERKKSNLEIIKLSVAIEQNPASVVITNTQGEIEYVNKKFKSVSGYSPEELIGKTIRILKPGHTSEANYIEIWNCLLSGKEWRGEHLNRTKNRIKYWESILISPIKNQEGKIINYIILSEDISDRKKMEKELISAKEKAEESDRLKSAFLANMSHEIRTPLNSILGFSDLLTDPNLDQITRNEYSSLINSSGGNLLAIINDVLDLSKIEAGQIELSESEFSARKLISEIQKEYSVKARSKGIILRLAENKSDSEIVLFSDRIRVKQVLINFVGNALKFTEKGYIEISVQLLNESVLFQVTDTGIGIDKAFHDKIFERFRQVESSQTRKYGGNGLGLAITKNLVELLGGKIWLESEPGIGSSFFFSLPGSFLVS